MRMILPILFFRLLVCGCSQASPSSFDRIQAGKDISFGCDTLHVDKRDGTSLEGIRIISKDADGQVTTTAKSGTLSSGTDLHTFKLTLKDVRIEKQKITCETLVLVLPER